MAELTTTCCIAGGGPAGMMLGFLLARAGVDTVVLEKHADFLRDFRGDTIHPSTLEVIYELGLLDDFLKLPHQKVSELVGQVGGRTLPFANFSHVPTHCKFLALMPQWDFLDFLARQGERYSSFKLVMQATVDGLIEDDGRVIGARAMTPDGVLDIRARLVVGADGRRSDVRAAAGLKVDDLGAPMDVLWFRLTRGPGDPDNTGGYIQAGHIFVMLNRGEYWQCAFVIPKGAVEQLRTDGLPAFRAEILRLAPFLRVNEIASWVDVKLLTVAVDRMPIWHRPGLICIGDAAHAMSPIGGVGINLAIQDAVAAANILAEPLSAGTLSDNDLAAVQERRALPTRLTQRMQLIIQRRVISRVLASRQLAAPAWLIWLFTNVPWVRRIPARLMGVGVRPEHVRTPHVFPATQCERIR